MRSQATPSLNPGTLISFSYSNATLNGNSETSPAGPFDQQIHQDPTCAIVPFPWCSLQELALVGVTDFVVLQVGNLTLRYQLCLYQRGVRRP
jgi:hypothetical protein